MKNLRNKVAVITGAGSGIGKALALNLAAKGARLVLSDIQEEGLNQTATEVRKAGGEASTHLLDSGNREAIYQFAEEVLAEKGQIDLVINNAGVALGRIEAKDLKQSDFDWLMNINFWGMVHGTQAFLPQLISRPEAGIVNVSSLFGLMGIAFQTPYCASKFAIRGYTEALRMEMMTLYPHVIVTSVHPGGVKTAISRNSRWPEGHNPAEREQLTQNFEKMLRTTPEKAAQTIVRGIQRKKTRVLVGRDAWGLDKLIRLFPSGYSRPAVRGMKKRMKMDELKNT